jgi:serine/threonine-protein kinase
MQTFVGQVVGGRYRLDRLLGAGGMGSVYAATQLDLGRHVAVKLLGEVQQGDPTLVRFEREARTAASLGHPHIVQVTDFQNVPGQVPFLVMELVAGRSLSEIVGAEGPLEPIRVARLAVQILSALAATHAVNIVHRDIKPANVMVVASAAGELVKVVDFGIAKLLLPESGPPLTHSGVVIGTASYMAPEQAMGVAVDGRADLYSVAACMFFALTRRKPIESSNMPAALLNELPTPIGSLRPDLDPALCALVMRGLAKDVSHRFQSANEMASALNEWLTRGPQPVSAQSDAKTVGVGQAFAPTLLAVADGPVPLAPAKSSKSSCLIWAVVAFGLLAVIFGVAAVAGGLGYYASMMGGETASDAGVSASPDAGLAPTPSAATPTASASAGPASTAVTGTAPRDGGSSTKAVAKTASKGKPCVGFGACGPSEQCDPATKICVCEKGSLILDCGSYCIRSTAPTDCGSCGNRCPNDHVCRFLQKTYSCQPCNAQPTNGSLKSLSCGVHACVDPNVNPQHCGACNKACAKDQKCVNGQCSS